MPYSRRGSVKGYSTGRASAARQQMAARYNAGARSAARRALFTPSVRKVLQKNSGELRGMDTALSTTGPIVDTVTTNGDANTLNLIESGNGSWNRVGRKAFLKSLRLRLMAIHTSARNPTGGNLTKSPLRIVVVWDKQPSSGSLPNFNVIFGQTSQDGTETSSPNSALRYDNTGRFSVLREIILYPSTDEPGAEDSATLQRVHHVDEFIDLKNRTTIFSGDSDPVTIADISSGGLYIYYRALWASDNSDGWDISSDSFARLRFTC